jgi:hypothetical protein
VCGIVEWIDPEWPDALKKCLIKLWELYKLEVIGELVMIVLLLLMTTTRLSWAHKTRKLFCRLLDEERRELFRLFLRVQYKPQVSSWGKFTLAKTLCT